MSEYDQTFDPNIFIGHCDLISRFSDFALYLDTQLVYFQIMSEYDQTFDPSILIGRCDLISRFSEFAFISRHSIGIFSYSFQIISMTRPLTQIYL